MSQGKPVAGQSRIMARPILDNDVVLTEPWQLDHDPLLPPRWDHRTVPTPRTVYLDQWCYDHLARDRAGRPKDPSEAGCFEYFRKLALDGQVVFLLSQVHYQENWTRTNEDARWDTAVTMAELTGFNTITAAGLDEWEAREAVAAVMGITTAIEKPTVFGWGLSHCLRGREAPATIVNSRTNQRLLDQAIPEHARAELTELDQHVAERMELAMLAQRDVRLEPHLAPFAPLPDDGKGQLLIQEEHAIRAAVNQHGRNESNVRAIVEARSFFDDTTFANIYKASQTLGVNPQTVLDKLSESKSSKDNRQTLSALIAAMPIQGCYSELRVQAHLQPNRTLKPSDGRDYYAIASVSPFVDYLVTDKSMSFLAESAGLGERGGATIMRRLTDLREQLKRDLATGP